MTSGQVAEVLHVLCAAAASDASVRVPALQKLQEVGCKPGFLKLLLEAYATASSNPQGRLLAIMLCKNVVDRHWQPRSGEGMTAADKTQAKADVLRLLGTAIGGGLPHLVELTILVRRICRFEFPKNWAELTNFLVSELQQVQQMGFSERTLAVITVLHHILKEQASKRLIAARKDFHQVGVVLTKPLGVVWCGLFERMRQDVGSMAGDERMWKLSRYLDGAFVILIAQGFAHLHEHAVGPQMVVYVRDKVSFLLGLLRTHPRLLSDSPFYMKNLKSMLKWTAILVRHHPLAFAQANVGSVLQLGVDVLQAHAALQGNPQMKAMVEGLLKCSLQLLTHSFTSIVYRLGPQHTHQGATLELAKACHAQFQEFVHLHPVSELCDLCCRTALSQEAEDVHEWLCDPEDQLNGPGSLTELRQTGDSFMNELGKTPYDQGLIQHVAHRMEKELMEPFSQNDSFEVVVRRDTLLSLLSLCQTLLKRHLQFQHVLRFAAQIVTLTQQLGEMSPLLLLPVRLCAVIKAWVKDIPFECAMPTLQILGGFMQEGRPKAVRLAALGPLRGMLDRFSDHEGWADVQGPLIDACLALLVTLRAPEVQWRCLNLVHLFLCEEAESGRYEIQERSLQRLLLLWKQPEQGELLICHALLDVLRALVLMSCRSKRPRLPLPPALLTCCLGVVSDCYTNHRGGSCSSQSSAVGLEAAAALEADAATAASTLGDRGNASATLFDSGNLLFLGILRTVDAEHADRLLEFFPQLVANYCQRPVDAIDTTGLEILVEYCALFSSSPQRSALLQPYYVALLQLCRLGLQRDAKDSSGEQYLQILQLLIAQACAGDNVRLVLECVGPLFQMWVSAADPSESGRACHYPLHDLLPLFCAWQSNQGQHFIQNATPVASSVALRLVESCRSIRPVPMQAALLSTALCLVEAGGAQDGFWPEFLSRCDDMLRSAQKQGVSAMLSQSLQRLKATLTTRLPMPARSIGQLQCAALPADLLSSVEPETCMLDEAAVVRWFVGRCVLVIRQFSAVSGGNYQVLLSAAPERVQNALRASGL